jgi:hypothetical protein
LPAHAPGDKRSQVQGRHACHQENGLFTRNRLTYIDTSSIDREKLTDRFEFRHDVPDKSQKQVSRVA